MRRRRLNEDEDLEQTTDNNATDDATQTKATSNNATPSDPAPTSRNSTSTSSSKNTSSNSPSISPSTIKSIIQSEVNKQIAKYKTQATEDKKSKWQPVPTSPKNTKNKTSSKKKKTNQTGKRSSKNQGFNWLYTELQPINISPNCLDKLVPFESKQIADILCNTHLDLAILSVVNPYIKPAYNEQATLRLQLDLIQQDFYYIPIYIVDRGRIADTLFIVFNLGVNPKPAKAFNSFLIQMQDKYSIKSYVLLIKGKFYLINQNQKQAFNTDLYTRVIYYYSGFRGIQVSTARKLFVNPAPVSEAELDYRNQRNEVSIKSKTMDNKQSSVK